MADCNNQAHYRREFPQYIFFGSSGGGIYFCFNEKGQIACLDPIAGEESLQIIAESLIQFAEQVGVRPRNNPATT